MGELKPGSILAKTLFEIYSGTEAIVVQSPPGAGKTTLIVETIAELIERREGLTIVVATPTRRAASDMTQRLAEAIDRVDLQAGVFSAMPASASGRIQPRGTALDTEDPTVPYVCTVASLTMTKRDPGDVPTPVDLMIFDEAYQTTFADFTRAAQTAEQVLLVGDPGQIGPVVTVDENGFEFNPARRCPEVVAQRGYATTLFMDVTYRLGDETTELIAGLYPFSFTSHRGPRSLRDGGDVMPELESFVIDPGGAKESMTAMGQVLDLALEHVGMEVDGREVGYEDLAIVVPHRSQVTALSALMSQTGISIAVGTADSMQGGQWEVVVSVDPLFGKAEAGDFETDAGRLCVMLSRHRAALLWVHDEGWRPLLDEGSAGYSIRDELIG